MRALRGRNKRLILAQPATSENQYQSVNKPSIFFSSATSYSSYQISQVPRTLFFAHLIDFYCLKNKVSRQSLGVRASANFGRLFLPRRVRVLPFLDRWAVSPAE